MIRSAREGIPDDAVNLHASVVVLDAGAVMVRGAAGAGKTHLALALIDGWQQQGRFARLLADDQVFVMRRDGRLLARTPLATAGLAEIRGVGIVEMPYEPAARVDLVVDLTGHGRPDAPLSMVRIEAVDLPLLTLRHRDTAASCVSVARALATIRAAPDGQNGEIMLASDNDLGLPSRRGRTT